jgi:hypothetical protein
MVLGSKLGHESLSWLILSRECPQFFRVTHEKSSFYFQFPHTNLYYRDKR